MRVVLFPTSLSYAFAIVAPLLVFGCGGSDSKSGNDGAPGVIGGQDGGSVDSVSVSDASPPNLGVDSSVPIAPIDGSAGGTVDASPPNLGADGSVPIAPVDGSAGSIVDASIIPDAPVAIDATAIDANHTIDSGAADGIEKPTVVGFDYAAKPLPITHRAQLLPTFAGGTGVIDNGIGTVVSDTPALTPDLVDDISYTLTVSGAGGPAVQQILPVHVFVPPFNQNEGQTTAGFLAGAYDTTAVFPTSFNWTRYSRFNHVDATIGELTPKWLYSRPDDNGDPQQINAQSVAIGADGTIFLTTADYRGSGAIVAIDRTTGKLTKAKDNSIYFTTGGGFYASPVIGTNGLIYLLSSNVHDGTQDGKLFAYSYDATAGFQKLWEKVGVPGNSTTPAIGADGTLYIGTDVPGSGAASGSPEIWALTPPAAGATAATIKWKCKLSFVSGDWDDVASSPVIGQNGVIYVQTHWGSLVAVKDNGTTGTQLWTQDKEKDYLARGMGGNTTIGPDGTLYLGGGNSDANGLLAVDPSTGKLKYVVDLDGNDVYGPVALAPDGTIYAAAANKVYAIKDKTATTLYADTAEYQFDDSAPLLTPDGILYIGRGISKSAGEKAVTGVMAIDLKAKQQTLPIQSFINPAKPTQVLSVGTVGYPAIDSRGTLYITDSSGYLMALGTK